MNNSNVITQDTLLPNVNNIRDIKNTVKKALSVLSKKERQILEKRYGLKKKRETLEKIGKYHQITRERVRQIEKNAISKLRRRTLPSDLIIINELGFNLLKKHGELTLEDKLLQMITKILKIPADESTLAHLRLCLALNPELIKSFNTIHFHPYWRNENISEEIIREISQKIISILHKQKHVVNQNSLAEMVIKKLGTKAHLAAELIQSVVEIDKALIEVGNNVGMIGWRDINPKTIRDKVRFILQKKQNPLHFLEIANSISTYHFDNKKINVQAVHNELIRNPEFVLIGRGIYALKKWGYEEGKVKDIIYNVLRRHKSLNQDQIIEEVLKQRKVKKITVLLNLKNKPEFQKIGRKVFKLKAL